MWDYILKITKSKRAGDMAQVVQWPNKCKALSSNSYTNSPLSKMLIHPKTSTNTPRQKI
jgi:hypothetical protein